MAYRLGLDLGTNSLGWALPDLDKNGDLFFILRIGGRIFSHGRNSNSLTSLKAQPFHE